VASNALDLTSQMDILSNGKTLSEALQSFVSEIKKKAGGLNDNGVSTTNVQNQRAGVKAAVSKLITTIEGSRDDSGEFSKAVETLENLLAGIESKIPQNSSESFQTSSNNIDAQGKGLVEFVGEVITKVKSLDKFREAAGKICMYCQNLTFMILNVTKNIRRYVLQTYRDYRTMYFEL
jgi:hypothetical protein